MSVEEVKARKAVHLQIFAHGGVVVRAYGTAGENGDWIAIRYEGGTAYIYSEFMDYVE